MARKQHILCLLLLWQLIAFKCQLILGQAEPEAQQLQLPRPRGRIRIADMQLPQPPPPPPQIGPLPGHGPLNWPNYAAVAPVPATSTIHAHIPLLREQIGSSSSSTTNLPPPSEGRVQEAVVYGNWKPEHPLKPNEDELLPKERVYGRLEAMLMGMPAEAIDGRERGSSEELESQLEQRTASGGYHNPYARRDSFERAQESRGRWRTPQLPSQSQSQPQPLPEAPVELVRMNATDPLLRAMAKQINESIETTTAHRQSTQTTEDNWMPLPNPYPTHSYESTQPVPVPVPGPVLRVRSTEASTPSPIQPTEATTIALNWPTDFLDATSSSSTERIHPSPGSSIDRIDHIDNIDRIDDDLADQNDDYKYYDDTLSSAQMHSELSVPESLIPQLPMNITRVGIPYEERNSAEEPTICVPLTVTETAAESSTPILVEVERVYCFPLPKVEIRTGNIRRPVEQDHSTSSTVTSVTTEQPQPALTAGASCHQNILAMLVVIGSSVLARL
ncbi:hypothetical protein ACLKA6_005320 [Drosophila palustris]